MRKIIIAAALMTAATMASAQTPQTFSTDGFSITFPAGWHAKKITGGIISATTDPELPAQASAQIYYGTLPANASDKDKEKFLAIQKKHSVHDYVTARELKASKWHSKITSEDLGSGVQVEKLDVEKLHPVSGSGKGKQPLCNYYREYHAPRAEVHLTFSMRGTCEETKASFDRFSSILTWNK